MDVTDIHKTLRDIQRRGRLVDSHAICARDAGIQSKAAEIQKALDEVNRMRASLEVCRDLLIKNRYHR